MTTPHGPVLLIANPRSGRGKLHAMRETTALLDASGVTYSVEITRAPGHATELAHRGVTEQGFRFVVAVGGDGTVNEVVNGLVDPISGAPNGDELVLGVVPGGSGCDFLKTWGLDVPIQRLVPNHLLTEVVLPIDLGRMTYRGPDGAEQTRLFANIAQCGWGADVTRRANALPRVVGPARYVLSTIFSTVRLGAVETTLTIDHTSVSEPVTEIVVANGQFFGGGMKVAPRALPDDGSFNVQSWRGGVKEVFENLPKISSGEHLSSATVREWQSSTVRVESVTPMTVEADGEVLGTTPASFEVLSRVLSLSA